MPKKNERKAVIQAHGVKCLLSTHPEIRKLKRKYQPSYHGNKVWRTNWILIDYLKKTRMIQNGHILDIGCGWGLSGFFLTKSCSTIVTGVDIDTNIKPYFELHMKINKAANIELLNCSFEKIRKKDLEPISAIIGADICFWDSMVRPLKRLINRAKRSSVTKVIIADPGRQPFNDLADYYIENHKAEIVDWSIKKPFDASGKILKIDM